MTSIFTSTWRALRFSGAVLFAAAAIVAATAAISPSAASNSDRYLIAFRAQPTDNDIRFIRSQGGRVSHTYHLVPAIAAELPEAAVEALRKNPNIQRIEKDVEVHAIDAELDSTWGVKHIGSGSVHSSGTDGSGVKIAVIDSGVDYTHSELSIAGGYDFVHNDSLPMDDNGHGTHVAGTVAAANNNSGVVGVAPGVSLYALKVLDAYGSGYYSDIIAALEWCVDNGIQITNNSYGSSQDPGVTVRTAFENAYLSGVLHVAAAGNAGNPRGNGDSIGYPARWDSVVAVTATDKQNDRAGFSSTGAAAELAAPGVDIPSTWLYGGYRQASGTSMASPHVAGAAALVLASGINDGNGDGRLNDDIRVRLRATALDLGPNGHDTKYGYGLVDAEAAVGGSSTTEPEPEEPVAGGTLSLTLTTDRAVYGHGDRATIDAWVYDQGGNPVGAATVDVLIQTPSGRNYSGVGSTDANGLAAFSFKVNSRRDGTGTYAVDGNATKSSWTGDTEGTTFEVR